MENTRNCFACGKDNVHGLKLSFTHEEGIARARFSLPRHFQGYPDLAHGGIITTVLDEAMAHALMDKGLFGVTGTLTVKFIRPVPLDVGLQVEGWLNRGHTAGGGYQMAARICKDGEELARAQALFVKLEQSDLGRREDG